MTNTNPDGNIKGLLSKLVPGIFLDNLEQPIDTQFYRTGIPAAPGIFSIFMGDGFDTSFAQEYFTHEDYKRGIDLLIPIECACDDTSYKRQQEKLIRRLRCQTVIDLGCGFNKYGPLIAKTMLFNGYVGVDVSDCSGSITNENWDEKRRDMLRSMNALKVCIPSKEDNDDSDKGRRNVVFYYYGLGDIIKVPYQELARPTELALVREDMLKFLKRLPDNSVSIMANGINAGEIISGRYQKEVISEISRVLSPYGFLLSDSIDIPDTSEGNFIRQRKAYGGKE